MVIGYPWPVEMRQVLILEQGGSGRQLAQVVATAGRGMGIAAVRILDLDDPVSRYGLIAGSAPQPAADDTPHVVAAPIDEVNGGRSVVVATPEARVPDDVARALSSQWLQGISVMPIHHYVENTFEGSSMSQR